MTRTRGTVSSLVCFFLSALSAAGETPPGREFTSPKREVRAVWLTTLGGADWPKSHDAEEQQESLVRIFENLAARHFNTVFFQVRSRGNAMYRSAYEPWATELTGVPGKDPGWDPLEFAIEEAHAHGLELHAWFNVAKVGNGERPPPTTPPHVVRRHPDWAQVSEGEWWVDMGIPAVREYTKALVLELARAYDLDGIHFDYIRYPRGEFNDWGSFRRYSGGKVRDEWRRDNITAFVRDVYTSLKKERPLLKVGSAPVGVYIPIAGAQTAFAGYTGLYQDARRWLRERIHDYVVPQLYWDIGEQSAPNDPDFKTLCHDWADNAYGRHVYAGIGAYRDNVQKEVIDQIVVARVAGCRGQSVFRYGSLGDIPDLASVYRSPALIPSMPWLDAVPPPAPVNVRVSRSRSGTAVLRWTAPPAADDGDLPWRYVVYRFDGRPVDTSDPSTIAAILPGSRTSFVDNSPAGLAGSSQYVVLSVDRANNESVREEPLTAGEPTAVEERLEFSTACALAQNYPNPFRGTTYIAYEVLRRGSVRLAVIDSAGGEDVTLVDGTCEPGAYIVAFDAKHRTPGRYRYELRIGAKTEMKYLEVVQ